MAFTRYEEKKGLSLPGLIDIIFLLLIFSLVTLSVSEAKIETKRRGDRSVDFDLPETRSKDTEEVDRILHTLLFEVGRQDPDEPGSPRMIWVLKPGITDSVSLQAAKVWAIHDSVFAAFPENFLGLSDREFEETKACKLIRKSIREYKKIHFKKPDLSNSVEIRAERQTEFRIVSYIMNQCSMYGDTIPRVVLRTLTVKEDRSGI